ncbi:peptidase C45 [Photobacterium angustum]|uniref:C45 family autoproteolytic acyltransferase/hydolase n=1 Tax=Photobacterium angustum TaxID=661 RepID=UPI000A5F662F|nr:C45 family autoproteolytic acyltransferase/hydolase [Photobacterium angustum]PSW88310.1 peptidase C45 [Photobacterium angustum]PSW96099.1 peptidase C45 [Photobacterium angustum]PSX00833.1 peptidase C45 [Photobacterium angustum]PSX38259.1 peptidase C45 [Photobacterium angustum]
MKILFHRLFTKKTIVACLVTLSSASYANNSNTHTNLTQYPPEKLLQEITAPISGELYKKALSDEQTKIVNQGKLEKINGWWHVGIKGSPFDRGFQYGYLIAPDFKQAWRDMWSMTYLTTGVPYSSWKKAALQQTVGKIPVELQQEMSGLAKGLTAAGLDVSVEDIIAWNDMIELTGYWWPSVGMQNFTKWVDPGLINTSKFPSPYFTQKNNDQNLKSDNHNITGAKGNCSAFIATGDATNHQGIVIGHETFNDFWSGQYSNVILNITPDKGYKLAFQTTPGMIESGTDFWETGAGLAVVETTLANVTDWKAGGTPEFIRARMTSQYANNIDNWVKRIQQDNNGGYANTWLIGDINNNRIAKFGQGRIYQYFNEQKSGYFTGENVSVDPRLRYIEGSDTDYNDIRQQEGARRLRWIQLMHQYNGDINVANGQKMLADNYDVYLNKNVPSSRNICAEYDKDSQPFVSDPHAVWNVPFQPAGSVDGKIANSNDIKDLTIIARFGRANGQPFNAKSFVDEHQQWAWESGYLHNRPSQPWTTIKFI